MAASCSLFSSFLTSTASFSQTQDVPGLNALRNSVNKNADVSSSQHLSVPYIHGGAAQKQPMAALRPNFFKQSIRGKTSSTRLQASAVAAGTTELDIVSKFSEIVPDTVIVDDFARFPPTAATVTYSLLLGIASLPDAKFEGAIESALAYGQCLIEENKDNRMSCFLDKALVNVGAQLVKIVPGRVSTEVDPRLAKDTSAIIDKVRTLVKLYNEVEVAPERILYKIPATWEGIEAARQLEDDGIQTHITGVHSFAQSVACAQAKVSVIQISLARVRDWARTNAGDPAVDAALQRNKDPGLELVKKACDLIYRYGHKTRVMASNLRNEEDVLSLLGVDYLVVPLKVLETLQKTAAVEGTEKYGQKIKLDSPSGTVWSPKDETEKWDEAKFTAEIGPCASQLLTAEIESSSSQATRVEEYFTKIWPPPNV